MAALDLVKTLIAGGVTFDTDGERIRWRNSAGRMTPDVVSEIASAKAEVIDFLTGKRREPEFLDAMKADAENYAVALRLHGPSGYGPLARVLGWGMTRTAQAEAELRRQGRVVYDRTGRGWLVEKGDKR